MNTTTGHTAGKWEADNLGEIWTLGRTRYRVADVNDNLADWRENAVLIASAPELLAALEETLRQLNAPDCGHIPDGAMVRGRIVNAIAKAKGGA